MLLNIRDVDFDTEWDLVVKHASRPIHKPSVLYNASYIKNLAPTNRYNMEYEFDVTPTIGSIPAPPDPTSQIKVDLLSNPVMVFSTGSLDDKVPYTTWFTASVSLRFSDTYPSSACSWYINDGVNSYWYCPYGFNFPSGYDIYRVNEFYAYTDTWHSHTLYQNVNGELIPVGGMLPIIDNVYYDVDLISRSSGQISNRTGSSNDGYVLGNSPYTTNMTLFVPNSTYGARGDMKGQILVTETPY